MAPSWRPEGELISQVAFEAIYSRSALSGAESDGLRPSHLQSNSRTQLGQVHCGAGIEAFLWRVVDEPDAFAPDFRELFLQSNVTALGGIYCQVRVRMTGRCLVAAINMRK